MPLFEYQCQDCEAVTEILVRTNTKIACDQCSSENVEKLLSAPAGHVKNSLPVAGGCPVPSGAPPCSPDCCRM